MNWKLKAFVQKTIDLLPFNHKVNYFFQKNITKKLPVPEWMFNAMVSEADKHFTALIKYQNCFKTIDEVKHYEFGSGWDMIVPITYYRFGINSQELIDLNYLLKTDLIQNTIIRSNLFDKSIENKFVRKAITFKEMGINYQAPMDASKTKFENEQFHFSSSTNVLEHVPKKDILSILNETYRILKKGGIFTFRIDYSDHYSYFDSNISIYNFLHYSDEEWKKFDHSLQPQTRIRHSEMIKLISETNFEIVDIEKHQPSQTEKESFAKVKLSSQFKEFENEDLMIGWAYIVLKK